MNPSKADIPLSALQHWLYCPRQYALIHLERLWAENLYTAEGRVLHDRADRGGADTRAGLKTLRSVDLRSARLGLFGVADVVELRGGVPYPVEYKRGRPKAHRADEVQLAAQALCLEDMFNTHIPEGALFYGQTRRRKLVPIDSALRDLVARVTEDIRTCQDTGGLPVADYSAKRCDACSLIGECRPSIAARRAGVPAWLRRQINAEKVPE